MNLSVGLPIEVTVAEDKSKATFSSDAWMGVTPSTMKMRDMDNKPVVHTGSCILFKNGTKLNVMEKYEDLRDRWMYVCGAREVLDPEPCAAHGAKNCEICK